MLNQSDILGGREIARIIGNFGSYGLPEFAGFC